MSGPERSGRTAQAGFTLLEALVALTILAIVAATILELASTGLDRVMRADRDGRAARLAESVLAQLDADPDAASSGTTEDGLTWTVERTLWVDPATQGGQAFTDQGSGFGSGDEPGGFGSGLAGGGRFGGGAGGQSGFGSGDGGLGAGDSGFGSGGSSFGDGSGTGVAGGEDEAGAGGAPLAGPATPGGLRDPAAPALWQVVVTVTDPQQRSIRLATLKLGRAPR